MSSLFFIFNDPKTGLEIARVSRAHMNPENSFRKEIHPSVLLADLCHFEKLLPGFTKKDSEIFMRIKLIGKTWAVIMMFPGFGTADFFHIQKYAPKKKLIQHKNTNQWHIYINGWRRGSRAQTCQHHIRSFYGNTVHTVKGLAQRLGQYTVYELKCCTSPNSLKAQQHISMEPHKPHGDTSEQIHCSYQCFDNFTMLCARNTIFCPNYLT